MACLDIATIIVTDTTLGDSNSASAGLATDRNCKFVQSGQQSFAIWRKPHLVAVTLEYKKPCYFTMSWCLMCAYVTVTLFIVVWPRLVMRKHINEHRVEHDYGLCMMVKTAQDGDFNAHTNLVKSLVKLPCWPHTPHIFSDFLVNSTCIIVLLYAIYGINASIADDYMCYWCQVMTGASYDILDPVYEKHPQDSHWTKVVFQ